MYGSFDVSALTAVGAGDVASSPLAFALRNNLDAVRRAPASSNAGLADTIDPLPEVPNRSANIAFDPARPSSSVRTLEELDRFEQKEAENRSRIEEHIQSLSASVANVQRSRGFMSSLASGSGRN